MTQGVPEDRAETAARQRPDWDQLPRLLQDYCDGPHGGGASLEIFAFDLPPQSKISRTAPLPPGVRRYWYCKSCWIDAWKSEAR